MAAPRRNDLLIPSLGVLFDAVAIECAFLLSYWLRFNTPVLRFLPLMEQTPPLNAYVGSSLVVIPLWLLIFKSGGMYGARRNVEPTDEFFQIVKFVTLGMLFVMSAAFFYRTFSYSRVVFVLLWISSVCTIGLDRLMLVRVERMLYRMGKELRNAVVVGCSATATFATILSSATAWRDILPIRRLLGISRLHLPRISERSLMPRRESSMNRSNLL